MFACKREKEQDFFFLNNEEIYVKTTNSSKY